MPQQETFLIRLGDLPDAVTDKIVAETRNYVVPLIINDIPHGSGTLVEIDGHYGILTAEHVARNPDRADLRLDNLTHTGPKLLVPPAEFPGGDPIQSYALRVFTTDRKSNAFGPDLAFIALPESPLLRELRARRSFFPIANDSQAKLADALQETGFVAFCGFPETQQFERGKSHGFDAVKELKGFAFTTGPDKYEERNGWDYFELGVDRAEVDDIGESFGGVSGGGIWRIPVYRRKGEPPGTEFFDKITFAGVAFYEDPDSPDGRFFVRAHGPKSLYETFLPAVREQLRDM